MAESGLRWDPPRAGRNRHCWWQFLAAFVATFALVLAGFAVVGGAGDFVQQAFLLSGQANPQPIGYVIWQDLPTAFSRRELELFALVAALLVLAALAWYVVLRFAFLLAIPVALA